MINNSQGLPIQIPAEILERYKKIKLINLTANEVEIYLDIARNRIGDAPNHMLSSVVVDIINDELDEYE